MGDSLSIPSRTILSAVLLTVWFWLEMYPVTPACAYHYNFKVTLSHTIVEHFSNRLIIWHEMNHDDKLKCRQIKRKN